MVLQNLFSVPIQLNGNLIEFSKESSHHNQQQTNEVFTDKWDKVDKFEDFNIIVDFQTDWYLKLYGFADIDAFKQFLSNKKVILDAGCGLGYKAAWFAELAPNSIVIGMDFSEAAEHSAKRYKHLPNLFFIRGDIADTKMNIGAIDYVSCDQVIMHTESPEYTFKHLSQIMSNVGEFACYVYSKKALPRELLDDYFRLQTHNIPTEKMWEFSEQLTVLGENLTKLNVQFDCPDIPVLGIKGGRYDVQRFIYWNFIKCFYNENFSEQINTATNYDWYSPSNAKRFTNDEFLKMASDNNLVSTALHAEEACYSGRFKKQ
jgi:SAM-dependent methyltransferase